MLLQVVFSDERSIAEVTLELLRPGVDEHVRRHVGLLSERLLADCASVVLLTCQCENMCACVNQSVCRASEVTLFTLYLPV